MWGRDVNIVRLYCPSRKADQNSRMEMLSKAFRSLLLFAQVAHQQRGPSRVLRGRAVSRTMQATRGATVLGRGRELIRSR